MQRDPEELRSWFGGVQGMCVELFNAAYLMCGSYPMAEYALRCALLDVWYQGAAAGMGFRERLRSALRRRAFEAALSREGKSAEPTWPGYAAGAGEDPFCAQLEREGVQTQRLVMLRHGCGLSPRSIARLTDLTPRQIRLEVSRFEARCRRRLPKADRPGADRIIARRARRLLTRDLFRAPRPGPLYRALEAEASGGGSAAPRAERIIVAVVTAGLALVCAAAFWLFAVLVTAT